MLVKFSTYTDSLSNYCLYLNILQEKKKSQWKSLPRKVFIGKKKMGTSVRINKINKTLTKSPYHWIVSCGF